LVPLTDPHRLSAYSDALQNWSFDGYVQFDLTESAYEYVVNELGITLNELRSLLNQHVTNGGEVDEVVERREEWSSDHEFHHDLRLQIGDRNVYVETRLFYKIPVQPDDSWILVVSVHDA